MSKQLPQAVKELAETIYQGNGPVAAQRYVERQVAASFAPCYREDKSDVCDFSEDEVRYFAAVEAARDLTGNYE